MASIDTDYRQVKPRELGPKPSCRRSSLKPNPNRARRFRPHEPSNRFRDRIDDAFSDNQSLLIHHADRRLLQRHVQSNIAFHCASPSLLGPHEADPSIPGELIPYALVWLDPGITPCCISWLPITTSPISKSREIAPATPVNRIRSTSATSIRVVTVDAEAT